MASPQKERGYVEVARELNFAILAARLGEAERIVLAMTIDQIYSVQKEPIAMISAVDIAKRTGLNKSNVHRAVGALVEGGVLAKADGGYRFIKDYESWRRPDGRPIVVPKMGECAQSLVNNTAKHKRASVVTGDNRRLSPETTGVVTEDNPSKTAELSPETTLVVTGDNRRLSPETTAAPAPYRNARQRDLREIKSHARPHASRVHAHEDAPPASPIDDRAVGNVRSEHRSDRDPSTEFVPPTADPRKAELALKVLRLIEDAYADRDSAEAYACAAIHHADAGLSSFAILEAYRRASAAGVPVVRVGKYVATCVKDIEAGVAAKAGEGRPTRVETRRSSPASNVHVMSPEARRLAAEQRERRKAAANGAKPR